MSLSYFRWECPRFAARVRNGVNTMEIFRAYAITFGWAIVGSIAMGLGIIIALKMFALSTKNVNEWELIKQNNISMAIVLAAVVIALGIVIAAAVHP